MHPTLIKIGSISLYTYGLFIALAFLTAITLAQKEARRYGASTGQITDLGFFILIAAIVGSRILYLMINPELIAQDPWEAFRLWNGGLVFYGGFIAAVITATVFMRKKKMPLWQTTDIFAPALAAGHTLGRIGCFFAGCCYGRSCELPWAVTFSHPDTLAPSGIGLHPAQLYSSASNLCIFIFLWSFRKHKTFDGQIFWIYVLLYGIARSILELFRGDPRGQLFNGALTTSQLIGLLLAVAAVVMLRRLRKPEA